MKIYFQNFGLFNKKKIKNIFNCALDSAGIDFIGFSVNLNIVSGEEIQKLNNDFRKVDKETDVLSFPNLDLKKGKNFDVKELVKEISIDDGLIPLGDIAICKKIAKIQAKNYGHSYKRELCFLALHGFLHLLGYDHLNKEDENEMQKIQEEILNKCRINR